MICFDRNADYGDIYQDIVDFIKMDPLLWSVIVYADKLMHPYGVHAVITSFMDKRHSGVHSTGRAVDLRSRHIVRTGCRMIEARINHEFPREDGFRTCIWHDVGQGVHLHLQVPATEVQTEEEKAG